MEIIYFNTLNFESVDGVEEYKAPTKIMLLPKSPITGRNGFNYSFDVEEILTNFTKNNLEIPIDINHATEIKAPKGEDAPAVGWVKSIEADVDGNIWGNVEWNNTNEWRLKYKEYKYYSPALRSDIQGKVNRINSVGLVNKPNFDVSALNFENNTGEIKMEIDKDILNSLGLNEGVSKDAVIQSIHNLKNNKELVEQINSLNMELQQEKNNIFNNKKNEAIDKALRSGKIAPVTKEFYVNTLNSEDTLQAFIETMDKAPSILNSSIDSKLQNKDINTLNFEENKHCTKYGLSLEEFKKKKEELFG